MVSRGPCTQLATIQNSSKIEFDERKISAISSWVESSDDIVVTRISQAHTFEYGVEVFDVNDQNWCDLDVVGRTSFASNAKIARIDYQAIWIFAWSHKWCVHVSLVIARRQQQTIPKWLIDRLELRTNELSSIIHWNGIIFLVFLLSLQAHIVSANGRTNNIVRSIIRFDGHSTEVVSIPVIRLPHTAKRREKSTGSTVWMGKCYSFLPFIVPMGARPVQIVNVQKLSNLLPTMWLTV